MRLSDDIKARIQAEYDAWFESQYAGKDKAERQKLAQFFTPPPLSIRMLEKFETVENKDILDPALGAGGLIAAAVIAGADPSRCYGIELDLAVLEVAKRRLARLGVPPQNLRQGDALDPKSYEFDGDRGVYDPENGCMAPGTDKKDQKDKEKRRKKSAAQTTMKE